MTKSFEKAPFIVDLRQPAKTTVGAKIQVDSSACERSRAVAAVVAKMLRVFSNARPSPSCHYAINFPKLG